MGAATHSPGLLTDPSLLAPPSPSSVPLVITPLDATNLVPISVEHVYSYGPQAAEHLFSTVAGVCV